MQVRAHEQIFFFNRADGSLYVDLQRRLDALLHLTSWSDGFELYRATDNRGAQWAPFEVDLGIALLAWSAPAPQTVDTDAVNAFAEAIPAELRALVAPFSWRQFTLLRLLRSVPEAASIVSDNPLLAWLLADWLAEEELHPVEARALVLGPRAELLRHVAGIDSQRVVKLLSRIRFDSYDANDLQTIRWLLTTPELQRTLSMLPRISGEVLASVRRHPSVLQFPVWRACVEQRFGHGRTVRRALGELETMVGQIRDIERMARDLAIQDPAAAYRACRTQEQLTRLHDRWALRLNQNRGMAAATRAIARYGTETFPAPPIPGSDSIRPIQTQTELSEEGALMHHCVAAYGDAVMLGRSYIYAVHAPERATLEVRVESRSVAQLKCAWNRPASAETYRAVQAWLISHRN